MVRENVCLVLLRIGRELREPFVADLAAPVGQIQATETIGRPEPVSSLCTVVAVDVGAPALGGVIADLGVVVRIELQAGFFLRVPGLEILFLRRRGNEQEQLRFVRQTPLRETGVRFQPVDGFLQRCLFGGAHRGMLEGLRR